MTLVAPETKGYETNIESRLDGYGIIDGRMAPAEDAAFPQEAISDLPAIEARQTKDYFSIQIGLVAEGIRIDEDAKRQITKEYANELTGSAMVFYRNQAERMPQNAAYLSCMDYVCRELEDRKQQALGYQIDEETTERPQQQLFMLGAKRYRESLAMHLVHGDEEMDEVNISVLVRDISLTGSLKLFQQAAQQRRLTEEQLIDISQSPETQRPRQQSLKPTFRIAAKTILHNLIGLNY